MKIDIDFDKLLNESVNAAVEATTAMTDKHPDFSSKHEQMQLIATVSAQTTIWILRQYHLMLENSLDTDATTH